MMFRKYKNYLKIKIAVEQYNSKNNEDKASFKAIIKSISDLTDDSEVAGVVDALNGIY